MGSLTRKAAVLAIISLLHLVAIVALLSVKGQADRPVSLAPMFATVINEPAAKERMEPLRPIELKTLVQQIYVPIPEQVLFELPVAADSDRAITMPAQATAQVAATADRSVPKLIETVEYVRQPVPRYPAQSRKLREQGLVMLRVLIDERGVACSIEIESSSGHARLDRAAREAVAQAAFRPYVEDGAPRRAMVLIPIEFSLNRSSA